MPLYEYECTVCAHRFEVIQKLSDPPVESCPACGGAVRKRQSAPSFQFKGSGWYVTDYARKDQPKGDRDSTSAEKEGKGAEKDAKGGEKGGEKGGKTSERGKDAGEKTTESAKPAAPASSATTPSKE